MNKERLRALQQLDCVEGALNEARRLVLNGANPQDIMRDFTKTKTSSNWIVVIATMAHWWEQYRRKREGE